MLYGNLADAALGELRFSERAQAQLKSAALKPATRMVVGLTLAVIGLTALVVLGEAPDRFEGEVEGTRVPSRESTITVFDIVVASSSP